MASGLCNYILGGLRSVLFDYDNCRGFLQLNAAHKKYNYWHILIKINANYAFSGHQPDYYQSLMITFNKNNKV